jgi:hypothetical protein
MVVVLGVVLGFLLPVLTVQEVNVYSPHRWEVQRILLNVDRWRVWFTALAAGLGLLVAMNCWAADHRGKHVYALSLPIPRWHYVVLRFGAGAVMLAAPVLALWIGSILAVTFITIPESLNAYPHALAIRFALAMFLSYSIFFAISSGTSRTAGYVLVGLGGLLVVQVLLAAAGADSDFSVQIFTRLVEWPGPFQIFTGRWMLIDV